MSSVSLVAGIVSIAVTVVAVYLAYVGVSQMLSVIRAGQPAVGRTDQPARRMTNMLVETLGHTRMLQWSVVGAMHWMVMAGFIFLSSAVLTGYFQVWDPHFALPLLGQFFLFEWITELLTWLTIIGIAYLIYYRQKHHPRRLARKSRFFGSTFWQAYFVEAIILGEGLAGLFIRGAEYRLLKAEGDEHATMFHFPLIGWLGETLFAPLSAGAAETVIVLLALAKILMAMVWLGVIARNITMGVAWHRFSAWFNIYFKRNADGSVALGGLRPIYLKGEPLDMEKMEDLEEEDFEKLGIGKVEDFSWKGILDFTTCTECGRCQSQCPAWNTEKPLSPKLLVMGLREHAYAKIPLLDADADTLTEDQKKELERPLIGDAEMYGVIDPDVLWSCTNCGACVQQCPVDIEHVDHIDDMRRFQVLVESNFPAELNNIFKGLERKGNPWGMNPKNRMDWAKDLDFEVKQVGVDVESLDEVEWLFWVGCAGAFEDRAKKTTQAVAELLNTAGVDFAVLGDGETCSGDPARRAGNEIVFMQLAMENAEVFKETKVKKVVSTCAHCFNTLKNEYAEFGVELEVVHHTQLLNRLVREKKLTPVAPSASAPAEDHKTITYHDPCFLGRHNKVYEAPRELLEVIPNATFTEMPRNTEKSFCCGAGGARMWMEENLGSRINVNRTQEAVATGAEQIAVGCPFCRVMLSDGLTAQQAAGEAREEVEVLDVAQMLLAAVKRAPEPTAEDTAGVVEEAEAATAAAAGSGGGEDKATEAEPTGEDRANEDSLSETDASHPAADAHEAPRATDTDKADLDEPAGESRQEDREVAAAHNIAVDDDGTGQGPVGVEGGHPTDDAEAHTASTPEAEPEPEPGDTTDPDAESVPADDQPVEDETPSTGGSDAAPAEEVTDVPDEDEPVQDDAREEEAEQAAEPQAKAEPAATSEPEAESDAKAEPEADQPEHEDMDEKEKAAWANVGPVNTDLTPSDDSPATTDDTKAETGSEEEADATTEAEPEAKAEPDAKAEPEADQPEHEDMDEKEKAAWANVGPVNTDLTPSDDSPATTDDTAADDAPEPDPEPDPGDTTDPDAESVPSADVPEEESAPADDDGADAAPAEEVTHVPDETERVQEDEREEEAGQVDGPQAKADVPAEVVAVEDAPAADPVSDDAAELTDANPSGQDLSAAATGLGTPAEDEPVTPADPEDTPKS